MSHIDDEFKKLDGLVKYLEEFFSDQGLKRNMSMNVLFQGKIVPEEMRYASLKAFMTWLTERFVQIPNALEDYHRTFLDANPTLKDIVKIMRVNIQHFVLLYQNRKITFEEFSRQGKPYYTALRASSLAIIQVYGDYKKKHP